MTLACTTLSRTLDLGVTHALLKRGPAVTQAGLDRASTVRKRDFTVTIGPILHPRPDDGVNFDAVTLMHALEAAK